jgi:hypothetical protein
MGVYRALAQLTFQAYKRGDVGLAATLGDILNSVWNNTERITTNGEGQGRLEKVNRDLCMRIDSAMDDFAEAIRKKENPPLSQVEKAYAKYLEVLKLAD